MFQLRPGETFPITRQLEDPADSTTYYVRAFIRWADTDELIDTLNLTDMTDQRFKVNFPVPADGTGLGRPLTITTKVYTNSGYTILSNTYGIRETVYLVFDRRNPYQGMGGGSGIDYGVVRKILKEEIANRPNIPKSKEDDMGGEPVDLGPVINLLISIKNSVNNIDIPEQKAIDWQPVLQAISQVNQAIAGKIDGIEIPPPTNIDPILERLDNDIFKPEIYHEKMDALFDKVKEFLGNDVDEIKDTFKEIKSMINKIDIAVIKKGTDINNDEDE